MTTSYNLASTQQQWLDNKLSNFDYLMLLNIQANRSFNDISQYPVFPWVLHELTSELDLNNKQLFRNLSLPVPAINKHRIRKLKIKQEQLGKYQKSAPLYRVHYSLPCNVKYFLIRKIPALLLRLQQEAVVPADRVFVGIEQAYYNTLNGAGDFKESIPEFYETSQGPGIFVNTRALPLGKVRDDVIEDAVLPCWAKSSSEFVEKHRGALESEYVRSYLNDWIDLIFGYKQKGFSAVKSDNHFDDEFFEENYKPSACK